MGLGRQRKHEDPSAGEHKSEDEVKVHVSFYGGLRVEPGELLRSKAAQNNIKKMCEVFGPRSLDASEAESRSQGPPAASPQQDFGDSGAG